jgi:AhpD family alkylhydroperoxidase
VDFIDLVQGRSVERTADQLQDWPNRLPLAELGLLTAFLEMAHSTRALEVPVAGRLEFGKLAPEGLARMRALEHYLNTETGLEPVMLDLVRLLVSLMNGCEYCINLHSAELRKLHEPEERIANVLEWRGAGAYTQRERAAFAWTEAVTNIQDGHAPDAVYAQMREHFSEMETVNLTLAITTINAWNRIAISLGDYPGHAGGVAS